MNQPDQIIQNTIRVLRQQYHAEMMNRWRPGEGWTETEARRVSDLLSRFFLPPPFTRLDAAVDAAERSLETGVAEPLLLELLAHAEALDHLLRLLDSVQGSEAQLLGLLQGLRHVVADFPQPPWPWLDKHLDDLRLMMSEHKSAITKLLTSDQPPRRP